MTKMMKNIYWWMSCVGPVRDSEKVIYLLQSRCAPGWRKGYVFHNGMDIWMCREEERKGKR